MPDVSMTLAGSLRLSDAAHRRTMGTFGVLVKENADVFRRYFGTDIFPGSLNIDVPEPASLQQQLDAGRPPPLIVIPRSELINMPSYIGDGQAWACRLRGVKFARPIECWIFRRKFSRVPLGVIELIAREALVAPCKLAHGDQVFVDALLSGAFALRHPTQPE